METIVFGSSSAGNGYLIKDGGHSLLLEAGISPKKITVDYKQVDGLLITHEHADHGKFAHDFIKRGAMDIYCSKGTAKALDLPKHRVQTVKSKVPFHVGKWFVLPFDVQHDAKEPVGYLIQTPSDKKVLFVTDTYYVKYQFKGVTHALVECNYSFDRLNERFINQEIDPNRYRRLLKSHFELENVEEFFKGLDKSRLEQIMLIHLSDANSDANYFKQRIQAVTGVPVDIAPVKAVR
ncbi:MBL fold metallo-hydrolase [Atopobacter phocae]|uniref:MBL fold metallo-hydrolase n=1 Tax=Atopobacter phocae TaxID=136492 RepID=UPI0004B5709F|nr:MBL fold metallo-hydrolase [Atopobacter phocae]